MINLILENITPNSYNSKQTIVKKAFLLSITLGALYSGFVFGIYSAIKAILKSIDKLKEIYNQKIIDFNNQILQVSAAIEEEAARVSAIPRYQELNSIMNDILSRVVKDRALNKYLEKAGSLSQWAYYDYCGYYLNGNFNTWPFAVDHYRTEWDYYDYLVTDAFTSYDSYGNSYTEYYDHWERQWYLYEVYDYTEYFEVNGSVNTEMANKFGSLYSEKTNFETHWNNLINDKNNLQKHVKDLSPGTAGRITGIVFIGIAGAIVTGLFIWAIYSLGCKSYDLYIRQNDASMNNNINSFQFNFEHSSPVIPNNINQNNGNH